MISFKDPGTCFFEDRINSDLGTRAFGKPFAMIEAWHLPEVSDALAKVARFQEKGAFLAGYIAYEAGAAFEPKLAAVAPAASKHLPLLRFFAYEDAMMLSPQMADRHIADTCAQGHQISLPEADWSFDEYTPRMARVLEYIRRGDIYQANLTFPLTGNLQGEPLSLYAALRSAQPVGFGAYLQMSDATVLSLSPELMIRRSGDRLITRPMKGTSPRGSCVAEDQVRRRSLRKDPKERAENLMIVDLLRNDLSRVCRPGTVDVRNLFEVETYPTLHTMTSTVVGELEGERSSADILAALFPCGSVTGAPKIRAQQIIQELEDCPRGIYTGAIGYLEPSGDFSFSVAIRTLTATPDGRFVYPVGGGIVSDSTAAREYEEAFLKGRVLMDEAEPFGLIETIAWTAGEGFALLARHLERLEGSAAYFGRPYDRTKVLQALEEATSEPAAASLRLRLLLSPAGNVNITSSPLETALPSPLPFIFSKKQVDAADPYLRHKTTRRTMFDRALAAAKKDGAMEALFENQYGEMTEGAWTSLFVEWGGKLLTPPISSGLLPGTLRADLLAGGRAKEAVLTREDIASADAVYLGNSVRGLMRAQILDTETAAPVRAAVSLPAE